MLIFENRKLKKKLMRSMEREDETMAANSELRQKLKEANDFADHQQDRIKRLDGRIADLEKQVLEASKMIREQTGADLLVNALRELGVVPKPDYPLDSFKEQQRLNDQMARAQAMRNSARPLSFGQSGVGNPLLNLNNAFGMN